MFDNSMQLFVLISALLFLAPAPQTISVTLSSTCPGAGEVRLAVYANAEDFAAKREVASAVRPYRNGAAEIDLDLPKAGTYVLAAFHDLNGNGKLDRNIFGIPTEPYGFSREPTSKWEAPGFADVASWFDKEKARAEVRLKLWREY
jgi:uncharacterized protein (DUF2141 family)